MADIRVIGDDDVRATAPTPTRHLISIEDLDLEVIERLLATARNFARSL